MHYFLRFFAIWYNFCSAILRVSKITCNLAACNILHLLVESTDYRTDSITLYFGLNSTWQTECYLCDNQTSMRRRIYNDSRIRIATPQNHEVRYYIQGPYKEPSDPDNLPMHRSPR